MPITLPQPDRTITSPCGFLPAMRQTGCKAASMLKHFGAGCLWTAYGLHKRIAVKK